MTAGTLAIVAPPSSDKNLVAPGHQGHGVGRALIEQVQTWAISTNLSALTLTTFGHIPWNRPLYEHLGFRLLPQTEISAGVRKARESEADHGLDPELRVVMWLDLSAPSRLLGVDTAL